MTERIVIIGSGNVATHLARGFQQAGLHVCQVYSRDLDHARRLADSLDDCSAIDNLREVVCDADLYVIAVSDTAVAQIAGSMPKVSGVVAHTSGSVPLDTIATLSEHTAVLYPLQTFTREAEVELHKLPFFTEASDDVTLEVIDMYVRKLSERVYHADSARRKTLHIAGVLSCNFVNYLWDCTAKVLSRDGYDFSVVEPLIRATLDKAVALGPRASQTGPAMRCDSDIMQDHISRLDPELAKIYRELSNAILKTHNLDCRI